MPGPDVRPAVDLQRLVPSAIRWITWEAHPWEAQWYPWHDLEQRRKQKRCLKILVVLLKAFLFRKTQKQGKFEIRMNVWIDGGFRRTVPKQDWHGTFTDTCTSTRSCDIKDTNPLDGGGVYVIIICFIAVWCVCFLKVSAFTLWECQGFSLHQGVIQCFLECWYDLDCQLWMWWSYVPFPATVRWHLFAQRCLFVPSRF